MPARLDTCSKQGVPGLREPGTPCLANVLGASISFCFSKASGLMWSHPRRQGCGCAALHHTALRSLTVSRSEECAAHYLRAKKPSSGRGSPPPRTSSATLHKRSPTARPRLSDPPQTVHDRLGRLGEPPQTVVVRVF